MKHIKILILIIILGFLPGLKAQQLTVQAKLDSAQMLIGQQTRLSFEYSLPKGNSVITPIFSDSIISGLELVEPVKADTTVNSDGVKIVKQSYTVTSFQDTLLTIPPYPFVAGNDTVWTKSLSLKVIQPFAIDTAKQEITDIKNVMDPPFNWKGLIRSILWVLLALALIVGGYFAWKKWFSKKSTVEPSEKAPDMPPHILAVQRLDKIKQEKLWQQNRSKEFHTQVTDVIREYIETVFEIPAMEMTTDEILMHLKHLKFEQKSAWTGLQQMLQLADLVKFAKLSPGPAEHELSLINAYLFVEQTTEKEITEIKEEQDVVS